MALSDPELEGARAELIRGVSTLRARSFEPDKPAWVRVGSAPEADWQIDDEDIAPAHCELLWDGHDLFVQDRLRLGRTSVNGQRVDGWRALPGDALLYLSLVCVRTRAPREAAPEPHPDTLRWVQQRLLDVCPSGPTRSS